MVSVDESKCHFKDETFSKESTKVPKLHLTMIVGNIKIC